MKRAPLLLACALLIAAPAAAQGFRRDRQSVRDLLEAWLRSRPDRGRIFTETRLSLGQGQSGIGAVIMRGGGQLLDFGDGRDDGDESEGLAALLSELLRRHALSDADDAEWTLRDGELTVLDRPEARAKARAVIQQLRAALKPRIELELRLLRAPQLPEALRRAEVGRPLSAEAEKALDALSGPKADRPRLRLLLYEEESGLLDRTRNLGVLEGYEINQTGVVPVANPVAGAVKAGVLAAARIARLPGAAFHLDLRLEWSRLESLQRLEIARYGPLELPRIQLLRLGTSLRLEAEKTVLIARAAAEGSARRGELAVMARARLIAPKKAPAAVAGRVARRYALDVLGGEDDFRFAPPWRPPGRNRGLLRGVLSFDAEESDREEGSVSLALRRRILEAAGSEEGSLEDAAEDGLFFRNGGLVAFAEAKVQGRIAEAIAAWYRAQRRTAVFEYGELRRAPRKDELAQAIAGPARSKRRLELAGLVGRSLTFDWHQQRAILEALPRYQGETIAIPSNEKLPNVVRRVVPDGIFLSLRGFSGEGGLRVGANLHRWSLGGIEEVDTAVGPLQRVVGLQHFAVQRLAGAGKPLLLSRRRKSEETLLWARARYLEETR